MRSLGGEESSEWAGQLLEGAGYLPRRNQGQQQGAECGKRRNKGYNALEQHYN